MEKRVLLAVVLSLVVLLLYQAYFVPEPPKPLPATRQIESSEVPSSLVSTEPSKPDKQVSPVESPVIVEDGEIDKVAIEPTPEPENRTIQISSRKYVAEISTLGAHLTGWQLMDYKDSDNQVLQFIQPDTGKYLPGDVTIGADERFNTALFTADAPSDIIVLDKHTPIFTINFESTLDNGLLLKKQFTFHHDSIMLDLDVHLINQSNSAVGGIVSVLLPDKILRSIESSSKNRFIRSGPALMIGEKREQPKLKKLQGLWVYPNPARWVAIEENFFFAALIPMEYPGKGFVLPTVFNKENGKAERASPGFQFGTGSLAPNEHIHSVYYMVLGPKKYDQLKELNIGIETIVNFGWITWLGKLFYHMLVSTTNVVKNYGLSILILTLLIKIILFPLSHISMKSMKKMQEIQPMMKDIQARYRKDPKKQQAELSKLYKKHGANPMSGCLPMLVQFPVFIALYQVLMNSIEMRGASFLWVADLSQPNILLVILMGASMLLQQKMTPTTGDPRQAKMMMFMPIIFTAMFWTFPSGLVLYWLMNNILTIAQQHFMNVQQKQSEDDSQEKMKARTAKKISGQSDENISSKSNPDSNTPFRKK